MKILAVKTYSLKRDGNKKLSDNFTVKEFACKDGSDKVLIDTKLVEILQFIRNYFERPVIINSAYRNANYNKKIGGASKSQHILGTASDIVVQGVSSEDVAKYAEYLMPTSGGIGFYPSFTHVDVRSNRSRWKDFGREIVVSGFQGHKNKEFQTVGQIVDELNRRGIITDKDLWIKKLNEDNNAMALAKKGANKTVNCKGKHDLFDICDIVQELNTMGIMDAKEYWLNKLQNDTNSYWLAKKLACLTESR